MCVYFRGHRKGNKGKGTEEREEEERKREEGIIFNQREEGTGLIPLYISYL